MRKVIAQAPWIALALSGALTAGCNVDVMRILAALSPGFGAPGPHPLPPGSPATPYPFPTPPYYPPDRPATPKPFPFPSDFPEPIALRGHVFGTVHDEQGRPALEARVTLFRIPDSDSVGSTLTDGSGRFFIKLPEPGDYNVEASWGLDRKAWKGPSRFSGIPQAFSMVLRLAPTGVVSGRVFTQEASITDLTTVRVAIPGSPYSTAVEARGDYLLPNVPAGAFNLVATVGDSQAEAEVTVPAGGTAQAPAMELKIVPPAITAFRFRANEGANVDNAAPGETIDIVGRAFGHQRSSRFEVKFAGGIALVPERLGDELIRVKVPEEARSGDVVVVVDGRGSDPLRLRILEQLTSVTPTVRLGLGSTADLARAIAATDTEGAMVSNPTVLWETPSSRVIKFVGPGRVEGISEGTAEVWARAGLLPARSVVVEVGRGSE